MKHLLNNISEEEKNRIREQHEGGMNLSIDNFKTLVETKLGDAKQYLTEASQETCEQRGGMTVEGECVEQCGSMKEEVSEQSDQDVINIIKRMVMKLDDGVKKDLESLNFDDNQKVSFFDRMVVNLNEVMSEELDEEINEQSSGVKFDDYAIKKLEGCGFEKVDDGKYIFNGNGFNYTIVAEKFANSNYIGHSLYNQDGNKYYSLPSDACWVEFDKLIGCK